MIKETDGSKSLFGDSMRPQNRLSTRDKTA
jgi:hypothetical protein